MKARIIVVLLAVVVLFLLFNNHKRPTRITAVAILPFVNADNDPKIDWISAGCVSTIGVKLCKVANIQYISMSHIRYTMKEMNLQDDVFANPAMAKKLGRAAGAKYIVLGSYNQAGDKIQIEADLINVRKPAASIPFTASGGLNEMLDIQTDLTRKIVKSIGGNISSREDIEISRAPSNSFDAYMLFCKGVGFQLKGDCDESIAEYNKAIRFDSAFSLAFRNRGAAYLTKRDFDPATRDLNRAIEIEPDLWSAFYDRAIVYSLKKEYDKAIADLDSVIKIDPMNVDAYIYRAEMHNHMNDYYEAIRDCSKAIELNPYDARQYDARGISYSNGSDYRRAIKDYTTAIELNPYNSDYYFDRGYAYMKGVYENSSQATMPWDIHPTGSREALDKALSDFDIVLKLNPKMATAYFDRATIYEGRHENDKAIADYQKFIKTSPQSDIKSIERAKKSIERLENR